jgi:hypothetical protein
MKRTTKKEPPETALREWLAVIVVTILTAADLLAALYIRGGFPFR